MDNYHDIFAFDPYHPGVQRETSLSILYLFSGSCQIGDFLLKPEDFIVLEPLRPFLVKKIDSGTQTILLRIPGTMYRAAKDSFGNVAVRCCSCRPGNRADYDRVRTALADLFTIYTGNESGYEVLMQSCFYHLLYLLMHKFGSSDKAINGNGVRAERKMYEVAELINRRHREPLTLENAAEEAGITPSYLSHSFHRCIGETFSSYLMQARLNDVIEAFQTGSARPVTELAYEAGFTNINSFYASFNRVFGMTPQAFRRTLEAGRTDTENYPLRNLYALLRYRSQPEGRDEMKKEEAPAEAKVCIDFGAHGELFPHTWQKIINVGYAGEIMNAGIQEQLRTLQKEIGFTHLRFHGILDEELHLYNEDEQGKPWLYFVYVDMLFDFLQSIHLTPYVEFSFIPAALAKHRYSPFTRQAYISGIKDLKKWSFLVRGLVSHCVMRYGLDAVRNWYFSFMGFDWIQCHWVPSDIISEQEYFSTFFATFRAVKDVDPLLRVGGPATDFFTLDAKNITSVGDWIRMCVRNDCPPDFIAMHAYPIEADNMLLVADNDVLTGASAFTELSRDDDYIRHHLETLRQIMRREGLRNTEVILDEWDSTLWQRDPVSDTCYHSSYIIRNILENADRVGAMAQAVTSDYSEETRPEEGLFFGAAGIFTYNGLRKNVFYCYRLLSGLGTEKIASGDGWAVFRNGRTLQFILWYGCHYHRAYGYQINMISQVDRYAVFRESDPYVFRLEITGIPRGNGVLRDWKIGRTSGSVFDKWVEMGHPDSLSPDMLEYLDKCTMPTMHVREFKCERVLKIDYTLNPHDVMRVDLNIDES